jgi:chromate reductase, NAD(P)H dehydrogenase (quinone)
VKDKLHLLGISGSLRKVSSNTALLKAAQTLAPAAIDITLYEGLATLPHFNPDIEEDDLPTVAKFRSSIKKADGLLISTPEYAHGLPGSLKNALDWLVGGDEFYQKPVALLNASSSATYAQASITEIIKTMAGNLITEACFSVRPFVKHSDEASILADEVTSADLQKAIVTFENSIRLAHQK